MSIGSQVTDNVQHWDNLNVTVTYQQNQCQSIFYKNRITVLAFSYFKHQERVKANLPATVELVNTA